MSDHWAETIEIIEQHGSFLLIRAGPRFAVVEKRAGRVYPMKPGERQSEPLTAEGLAAAMAEEGWLSEEEARRQYRELCDRGDRLARSLR
jgi:fructose-1,6-bisphosphatase/inositol monophosphatase family enzyme